MEQSWKLFARRDKTLLWLLEHEETLSRDWQTLDGIPEVWKENRLRLTAGIAGLCTAKQNPQEYLES